MEGRPRARQGAVGRKAGQRVCTCRWVSVLGAVCILDHCLKSNNLTKTWVLINQSFLKMQLGSAARIFHPMRTSISD